MLYAGEKVYDDHNAHELTGDGKVVFAGGEMRMLSAMPRKSAYGSIGVPTFGDNFKVMTRSEIIDRAVYLDENEAQISDLLDYPSKDQNGLPYCWIYGCVGALEAIRRVQGLPYVELSAESAGGPITGYRSRGGYGEEGLQYLSKTGVANQSLWPKNKVGGPSNVTAEVKADYENHRIKEWFDCETNNVEQLWTMLVLGFPCPLGLNWWGHLIFACGVVVDRASNKITGTRIRNSWAESWGAKNKHGVGGFGVLTESKSRGDFFGVRSVTASTK